MDEALTLNEADLDPRRGSLLVRRGKGGRRPRVGMDDWAWEPLAPWLQARVELPVGLLFCVVNGATRGRPWAAGAAGCVGCSSFADGIPQLGLLHSRDITLAMASPAPQANLCRYAERMGWTNVPWYTICTEPFSADFGVDKWFGLNVFLRDGNDVCRTYFLQHGAMVQFIGSIWSMWSLTPYGGQSDDEDLPEGWPRAPQTFWFRRHDEFDDPPPSVSMVERLRALAPLSLKQRPEC